MESISFTKQYYKIKDVAEMLEVPQTTLRFWEKEFPEIKPRRTSHNQRHYTPKDIETIRMIYFLIKVKGMRIESAREYLRLNRTNVTKKLEILDSLTQVKNELSQLLETIDRRIIRQGIGEKDSDL